MTLTFDLKALTAIWTGGAGRENNELRLTGLRGSIRWWYEALVRGLGGYACDPIGKTKCELVNDNLARFHAEFKRTKSVTGSLDASGICPACQLFGCTGCGAKFRLDAVKIEQADDGNFVEKGHLTEGIGAGTLFRLKFIELKPFSPEEKKLLNATIKLIVEYGAIGGKTALKPSELAKGLKNNNKPHHLDYGILKYADGFSIAPQNPGKISPLKSKANLGDWPNLTHFFFLNGTHIDRIQHNGLVSRETLSRSGKYTGTPALGHIFLGGFTTQDINGASEAVINSRNTAIKQGTESKKIFSFHGQKSGVQRCFGYAMDITQRDGLISSLIILTGCTPPQKGEDVIKIL